MAAAAPCPLACACMPMGGAVGVSCASAPKWAARWRGTSNRMHGNAYHHCVSPLSTCPPHGVRGSAGPAHGVQRRQLHLHPDWRPHRIDRGTADADVGPVHGHAAVAAPRTDLHLQLRRGSGVCGDGPRALRRRGGAAGDHSRDDPTRHPGHPAIGHSVRGELSEWERLRTPRPHGDGARGAAGIAGTVWWASTGVSPHRRTHPRRLDAKATPQSRRVRMHAERGALLVCDRGG